MIQAVESGRPIYPEYFSLILQQEHGHGLGMMIVNRIMQEHGGQAGIESREGDGTLITLQFPLQHRRSRLLVGESAQSDFESPFG